MIRVALDKLYLWSGYAAGFFLVTEHAAHLYGALPFLLLLACPLMHYFHHGHGHDHRQHRERSDD